MGLRAPLRYPGGKITLSRKLVHLIPPHKIYVEVFGGGAALLFTKPPSEIEVYNDIDFNLVNFFSVLKDKGKFEKFYQKALLTPYSREEFYACKNNLQNNEIDTIEIARCFFVLSRQCYSGGLREWGFDIKGRLTALPQTLKAYLNMLNHLPLIAQRLSGVVIENRDFKEIIELYDSADTFFYLDPPYVFSARKEKKKQIYQHEMNDYDHKILVDILLQVKGKFMLSGYYNEIYSKLEANGVKRFEFPVICNLAGRSRAMKIKKGELWGKLGRVDCIWINYDLKGNMLWD